MLFLLLLARAMAENPFKEKTKGLPVCKWQSKCHLMQLGRIKYAEMAEEKGWDLTKTLDHMPVVDAHRLLKEADGFSRDDCLRR